MYRDLFNHFLIFRHSHWSWILPFANYKPCCYEHPYTYILIYVYIGTLISDNRFLKVKLLSKKVCLFLILTVIWFCHFTFPKG